MNFLLNLPPIDFSVKQQQDSKTPIWYLIKISWTILSFRRKDRISPQPHHSPSLIVAIRFAKCPREVHSIQKYYQTVLISHLSSILFLGTHWKNATHRLLVPRFNSYYILSSANGNNSPPTLFSSPVCCSEVIVVVVAD